MKYAFLIISILALTSCADDSSDPVSKLPQYHTLSRAAVISELGNPDKTFRYAMTNAVGEFRAPLLNTYPLTNPANTTVLIDELWWDDGGYWITLWLHKVAGQWVVLDSRRWRKDIVF